MLGRRETTAGEKGERGTICTQRGTHKGSFLDRKNSRGGIKKSRVERIQRREGSSGGSRFALGLIERKPTGTKEIRQRNENGKNHWKEPREAVEEGKFLK